MAGAAVAAAVGAWVPAVGQQAPAQPTQKVARTEADGKLERLDGLVELYAIQRGKHVPAEVKEKIKPLVRNWLLEVQQQVIDNLDFIIQLEPLDGKPGFFETFDPANAKDVERVGAFSRQLMSAGPLINTLEFRRALDTQQAANIRQAAYEYDFALLQEVMAETKDHKVQMRHQYRMGYRDAIGMFHRLLDRAAPKVDEAVAAAKLSPEETAAAAPLVAAVKAAKEPKDVRVAVKALLATMSFPKQRAFMVKVGEASPIDDPYSIL
jgi:hypothetical protein